MFPGIGTLVNVTTVLVGTVIGVLARPPAPASAPATSSPTALGLVTLLIAGLGGRSVTDPALSDAVGASAPMLIVLGSLLVGGIIGSVLGIEDAARGVRRLAPAAGLPRSSTRSVRPDAAGGADRQRFIEGFVTASLVFCVGPLTVLGSLNDGLGNGADQLFLKAALDGFAAIAFAASLGLGGGRERDRAGRGPGLADRARRRCSATSCPTPTSPRSTATGGLMLVGVALRLLRIKQLPVGDLLPGTGCRTPADRAGGRRSLTPFGAANIGRRPRPQVALLSTVPDVHAVAF